MTPFVTPCGAGRLQPRLYQRPPGSTPSDRLNGVDDCRSGGRPARRPPRGRVHWATMPPRPGDERRARRHHARLRRAGRRTRRRVRRVRARRRTGRPRARARHEASSQSHAEAQDARDPDSLPAPRRRRAAATPTSAAAASGRRSTTRRSWSSSSSRWWTRSSASRTSTDFDARAHPRHGRPVAVPQQDGVLVRRADEAGRLVLGLHKRGSWKEIVDVVDCLLASERMNRARLAVADGLPRPRAAAVLAATATAACCATSWCARDARSGDLLLNLFVAATVPRGARAGSARRRGLRAARPSPSPSTSRARTRPIGDGPHMLLGPPHLCASALPVWTCACRPLHSCRPTAR